MLGKLLVEFTKSRACRSQDNALVEGKEQSSPYQKLKSLPGIVDDLKDGISLRQLNHRAGAISDTGSAQKMSMAKAQMLRACNIESPLLPARFL